MMPVSEVIEWLTTLNSASSVAVDDGGLTLLEVDEDGQLTDACLEVGGVPLDADAEWGDDLDPYEQLFKSWFEWALSLGFHQNEAGQIAYVQSQAAWNTS